MKNLIYILIFLPSLLFSQEIKNMELVGVRNITCDSGNILKVLSVTHSAYPGSANAQTKLNNEYIYYNRLPFSSALLYLTQNFPFYLSDGNHTLWSYDGSSTLYTIEFKLTSQ